MGCIHLLPSGRTREPSRNQCLPPAPCVIPAQPSGPLEGRTAREGAQVIPARSLKTLSICLSLGVGIPVAGVLVFSPQTAEAAETGTISGVVTNAKSGERMANALVVLQCTCLQGQ